MGEDPVEFYSKLAGDEVRLEKVDGRPVVVSGTFQGLFAALLTHLGTLSDHPRYPLLPLSSSYVMLWVLYRRRPVHRDVSGYPPLLHRLCRPDEAVSNLVRANIERFALACLVGLTLSMWLLHQLPGHSPGGLRHGCGQLQGLPGQAGGHSTKVSTAKLCCHRWRIDRWLTLHSFYSTESSRS